MTSTSEPREAPAPDIESLPIICPHCSQPLTLSSRLIPPGIMLFVHAVPACMRLLAAQVIAMPRAAEPLIQTPSLGGVKLS